MSEQSAGVWAERPLPAAMAREWAEAELGTAELGDVRRTRRLVQVASALAAAPTASIPQACGDAAQTKGAYRFFEGAETVLNADLPAAIRTAHCRAIKQQLADQAVVLAVQDTTDLTWHTQAIRGLGPLEGPHGRGLFVHSTLAVTLAGVPLGLLAQQVWAREPTAPGRATRRQRAITAKESQKWLTALTASRADLPSAVTLVHVGDREADIYDLFRAATALPQTELLVRAAQDRRVAETETTLWPTVAAQPVADTRAVPVPRAADRPARDAQLTLRWTPVTLQPPRHRASEHLPPIPVTALLVQEEAAPPGEEPIAWLLLTTLPVPSVTAAWERVHWYTYRWRIERYHFVLKSGCRLEQRHLETDTRQACSLAVYSVIACWLLRLLYQARTAPAVPALTVVNREEWAILWHARHPDAPLPPAPTLRDLVREIAALGGFLGRRQDGEPGLKTLWQGLSRLRDLLLGYHLARHFVQNVGNG